MKIIINNLREDVIVGCYDFEQTAYQPLIINVACDLYDNNWYKFDELSNTVDYDELVIFIRKQVSLYQYQLLESLAQFIAQAILNSFGLIKSVLVEFSKPLASINNACDIVVSHHLDRQFNIALALGSNHPFLPQQQIITAIELLSDFITNVEIAKFYQTIPVSDIKQHDFINTAIIGKTSLAPDKLISKIKYIEKLMGKNEVVINGPRIIDIDIIFYEDWQYSHHFIRIPHQMMLDRDFVLMPLCDIARDWVHPVLKQTVGQLYEKLTHSNATSNIIKEVSYYKHTQ